MKTYKYSLRSWLLGYLEIVSQTCSDEQQTVLAPIKAFILSQEKTFLKRICLDEQFDESQISAAIWGAERLVGICYERHEQPCIEKGCFRYKAMLFRIKQLEAKLIYVCLDCDTLQKMDEICK